MKFLKGIGNRALRSRTKREVSKFPEEIGHKLPDTEPRRISKFPQEIGQQRFQIWNQDGVLSLHRRLATELSDRNQGFRVSRF
jgi:hypothetical protein